ncbi:MAG: DUF3073 domain-containing protein [Propionibacteriaceae bacterium]|jgi:hypothetical protein|nr:DUF3073 domain-containing protein [Propionibacteriaceae bacterium]
MGRGRQKAKQTKVARELKYRSVSTDFASLQEELRKTSPGEIPAAYADLAEGYDDPELDEDDEFFDDDESLDDESLDDD